MTEGQSWALWGEDEEAARLPMQLSPPEHAAWHRWEAGRSPAVTQAGSATAPRGCQGGALAELGDPGLSPMGPPPRAAATSRGAGPPAQSAGGGRVHIPTAPLLPHRDTAPRGIQLLLKSSPG